MLTLKIKSLFILIPTIIFLYFLLAISVKDSIYKVVFLVKKGWGFQLAWITVFLLERAFRWGVAAVFQSAGVTGFRLARGFQLAGESRWEQGWG